MPKRVGFGAGDSRVLHPGFCQLEGPRFVSERVRAVAEGFEVARCRSEIPNAVRTRVGQKMVELLEARVGIEPTHKGFADLSLTTWVPRLGISNLTRSGHKIQW